MAVEKQSSRMSVGLESLLLNDELLNISAVAPSPSRDYLQLLVTLDKVTLRRWAVSRKRDVSKFSPSEIQELHEDFHGNYKIKSDIKLVFGEGTLEYVRRLVHGEVDYLPRMSTDILYRIIDFLQLEDIFRLSLVSKRLNQLCISNELWERLYLLRSGPARVTEDLRFLADQVGWRRLYFTNKMRLQMQLRRLRANRQHTESDVTSEDHVTVSDLSFETSFEQQTVIDDVINVDELRVTQSQRNAGNKLLSKKEKQYIGDELLSS